MQLIVISLPQQHLLEGALKQEIIGGKLTLERELYSLMLLFMLELEIVVLLQRLYLTVVSITVCACCT